MTAIIKKSLVFQSYHLDAGHDVKVLHKASNISTIEVETMGKIITGDILNKQLIF